MRSERQTVQTLIRLLLRSSLGRVKQIWYLSPMRAHPRSLVWTSAARSYKQWVKRYLQTESQIPGPSEWLACTVKICHEECSETQIPLTRPSLIWVGTACPGLSVQKLRMIIVDKADFVFSKECHAHGHRYSKLFLSDRGYHMQLSVTVTGHNNSMALNQWSFLVQEFPQKIQNEPYQANLCLRAFRHDKF